jgi:hypothetical protein
LAIVITWQPGAARRGRRRGVFLHVIRTADEHELVRLIRRQVADDQLAERLTGDLDERFRKGVAALDELAAFAAHRYHDANHATRLVPLASARSIAARMRK